jgi:hypothetical protein
MEKFELPRIRLTEVRVIEILLYIVWYSILESKYTLTYKYLHYFFNDNL